MKAGMDLCLGKAQRLRKSKKYSNKRIRKVSSCFKKPLGRHWRCIEKAGKVLKFFLNLVKKEYSKQKKLQKTKKVAKIDKIEEGEFDFEEPSEKEIESEIEEEIVEN